MRSQLLERVSLAGHFGLGEEWLATRTSELCDLTNEREVSWNRNGFIMTRNQRRGRAGVAMGEGEESGRGGVREKCGIARTK